MEFLICEVEDSKTKKSSLYAFPTDHFVGISTEFEEGIFDLSSNYIGYALYNNKLYPIFNFFTGFEKPLFKIFLIYKNFAVGATRPITKIEINEFMEINFEGNLKGLFYFEGERVLVLDLEKASIESNASFSPLALKRSESQIKIKDKKVKKEQNFVILEETDFALKFDDIEEIVEIERMCPLNFEGYVGFVSKRNGEIVNVESLVEKGKWILITKNGRAFRISRILIISEKEIKSSEDNSKYLIFEKKNYKILR